MKFQCILISLAFVKLLAMHLNEYKKLVSVTNEHYQKAFGRNEDKLRLIIQNIVDGDKPIDRISMMLAVPELANSRNLRALVEEDQISLQTDILRATGIPVPEDPSIQGSCEYVLPFLGKVRRVITRLVTQALILDAIDKGELFDNDWDKMCRLIGLLRNTVFTKSFTKTTHVDNYGNCAIEDSLNDVTHVKVYKANELTEIINLW